MRKKSVRRARPGTPSQRASRDREGYWAAPGVGPFAVPVERRHTLHDGYEPIRLRRPHERIEAHEESATDRDEA